MVTDAPKWQEWFDLLRDAKSQTLRPQPRKLVWAGDTEKASYSGPSPAGEAWTPATGDTRRPSVDGRSSERIQPLRCSGQKGWYKRSFPGSLPPEDMPPRSSDTYTLLFQKIRI